MNPEDFQAGRTAWHKQVSQYLEERGIRSELGADKIPFAVVGVWKCDERVIRRLGAELAEWTVRNRDVQIFGLEQMLEGRQPEVAARLFSIPMIMGSSDPKGWVVQVALVVLAKNHSEPEAKLAASLSKVVSRHKPAFLDSHESYCAQRR